MREALAEDGLSCTEVSEVSELPPLLREEHPALVLIEGCQAALHDVCRHPHSTSLELDL